MSTNQNTDIVDAGQTGPGAEHDARPACVATMRETARLLLAPDAAPEALPAGPDELDTLTATLRGHLELLAPEVERAAGRLPKGSIPRYCAQACVGEARGKLRAEPKPGLSGAVAHARRLARVLKSLSAECTLAKRPDYRALHRDCTQTVDVPLPHATGILLQRRCGCSCHDRRGGTA